MVLSDGSMQDRGLSSAVSSPQFDISTGDGIRGLRNKFGYTQEEFAHEIGITVSTVNRWENGHSEPSKLAKKTLKVLADKAATFKK